MEEVERRGLTGGIDLVRGIREEIRDIEFQLSEASSMNATCRAKISWMHSQLNLNKTTTGTRGENGVANDQQPAGLSSGEQEEHDGNTSYGSGAPTSEDASKSPGPHMNGGVGHTSIAQPCENGSIDNTDTKHKSMNGSAMNGGVSSQSASKDVTAEQEITSSARIATGDSTAIALRYVGCLVSLGFNKSYRCIV